MKLALASVTALAIAAIHEAAAAPGNNGHDYNAGDVPYAAPNHGNYGNWWDWIKNYHGGYTTAQPKYTTAPVYTTAQPPYVTKPPVYTTAQPTYVTKPPVYTTAQPT
ncbi:hypothetical protein IW139_003454, partial [Coemansia sp. RSA 353]